MRDFEPGACLVPDDPTDDLNKPLGKRKKKKKPFVLPIPVVTRSVAALLCLCVAVLAGWIMFVDDPFGGEPMVIVSAAHAAFRAGQEGGRGRPHRQSPARRPRPLADGDKPAAKTVTIIDGSTGKRQEVTVGQPGAAAEKKSELKTPGT